MDFEIVGKKIKEVRMMTDEEMKREGWCYPSEVIVLEDGTKIYASTDCDREEPGYLVGVDVHGAPIHLP